MAICLTILIRLEWNKITHLIIKSQLPFLPIWSNNLGVLIDRETAPIRLDHTVPLSQQVALRLRVVEQLDGTWSASFALFPLRLAIFDRSTEPWLTINKSGSLAIM